MLHCVTEMGLGRMDEAGLLSQMTARARSRHGWAAAAMNRQKFEASSADRASVSPFAYESVYTIRMHARLLWYKRRKSQSARQSEREREGPQG